MKKIPILVWALTLFGTLTGTALSQTFSLYRLHSNNHKALSLVADKYEIVGRNADDYEVYVPLEKASIFERENPGSVLLSKDVDANWRNHWNRGERFASGYRDYNAIQSFIQTAVKNHPDIASSSSYGKSKNGYQLNYLKLTSEKGIQASKPKLFLDAATHGDELISTEVLLNLVQELLDGSKANERIKAMLDKTEIYVSFVVNPDGFVNQQRYEGFFVDPNRSYPWPGEPEKKPTPSIQALIDLFEKERFAGSMTFHAYGKLLMYPWGYTRAPISDITAESDFDAWTTRLASTNDYTHGTIANTIYVAKGSSADYYYWKYGTKSLAVELSTSKVPNPSKIPEVVDEAREMVWLFIESFYP